MSEQAMERRQAVGYLRKSTRERDKQQASIAQQRAEVERAAARDGYQIVEWFEDARSGSEVAKRPGFVGLLAAVDAPGRAWDRVYVWDSSRFTRGGLDEGGHFRWVLAQAGVTLQSAVEQFPEDMGGELMRGVKDALAHDYVVRLSDAALRGMEARAREANYFTGTPPFGYDRAVVDGDQVLLVERWTDGGRREVAHAAPGFLDRYTALNVGQRQTLQRRYIPSLPARVAAIQRAFALAGTGHGLATIARMLNEEGHPSPRGRGWGTSALRVILRNPSFAGTYVYGASAKGKHHRIQHGQRVRVAAKGPRCLRAPDYGHAIRVPNAHEALVPLVEWERVQRVLASQASRQPRGCGQRSVHLLSGLLRCVCARPVTGSVHAGGRRYYGCNRQAAGHVRCTARLAPAERVDEAVLGDIAAYLCETFGQLLDSPEFAERIAASARAVDQRPLPDTAGIIERLARNVERMARRIADHPDLADVYEPQLRRLKQELDAARQATPAEAPRIDRDLVVQEAMRLRRELETGLAHADRRVVKATLRRLIREAEIDTASGTVILSLVPPPGGPFPAELSPAVPPAGMAPPVVPSSAAQQVAERVCPAVATRSRCSGGTTTAWPTGRGRISRATS